MRKVTLLIALGSTALLSADQYQQSQPYGNRYADQTNIPNYQQQNDRINQDQNYRDDRNYQTTNPNYQPSTGTPSYNQQTPGNPTQTPGSSSYNQTRNYYDTKLAYQDQYSQPYANRPGTYSQDNYQQRGNWGDNTRDGQYYQQNRTYDQQPYIQRQDRYGSQTGPRIQVEYRDQYGQGQRQQYAPQYRDDYDSQSTTLSPDQELRKKIEYALSSGWFSKGFESVSFNVNNGTVTLYGTVDSIEDKNKVDSNIRNINGVRQILNQITVMKQDARSGDQYDNRSRSDRFDRNDNRDRIDRFENRDTTNKIDTATNFPQDSATTPLDKQINAKIRDKLNNNWFSKNYDTIVVRTSNGIVVISGTIDKNEDGQKIIDQIKEIDGVRTINSQLRLKNQ